MDPIIQYFLPTGISYRKTYIFLNFSITLSSSNALDSRTNDSAVCISVIKATHKKSNRVILQSVQNTIEICSVLTFTGFVSSRNTITTPRPDRIRIASSLPPIQWLTEEFYHLQRQKHKTNYSPPPSVQIKNA